MSSGIYLLKFSGTDEVYIGKSKNIEIRFSQHKSCFKASKAAVKLQKAYHSYGMPELVVLEKAPEHDLEYLEKTYIEKYNSVDAGLNTRKSTSGGHSGLWGTLNGRSKYSNEQIADVLFLLISNHNFTYPVITKKTGVPKSTIVDIANGTGHLWLQNFFPEEYSLLLSFRHRKNSRKYLKAVSPSGVVYEVTHLSNFCKEHNLPTGNMSRLLRGLCNKYGEWTAI